eukprot:TRINITY_DN1163_c0_g1_i2.p1 TRINITY_DN1163_c0_g1~~TRINITY_DN1163_c0_g1_i2.p1  ORF type:complete len:783 (-),score=150.10 TRINITY_DN1163_c0_g1_i2:38-2386(-)
MEASSTPTYSYHVGPSAPPSAPHPTSPGTYNAHVMSPGLTHNQQPSSGFSPQFPSQQQQQGYVPSQQGYNMPQQAYGQPQGYSQFLPQQGYAPQGFYPEQGGYAAYPPQQGFGFPQQYQQQQQQQQYTPQQPTRLVGAMYATEYRKLWDDTKTNAFAPAASLYAPIPPEGFHAVGHVASRGHGITPETGRCLVFSELARGEDDPPLLIEPLGYKEVWNDQKTGAKFGHVSIWLPVAPEGYVTLGFVAAKGYDQPPLKAVRCVHRSIVVPGKCTFEDDDDCIWNDRFSGARLADCSWWHIAPRHYRTLPFGEARPSPGVDAGTFAVSANYNRPNKQYYAPFCVSEEFVVSRELGLPRQGGGAHSDYNRLQYGGSGTEKPAQQVGPPVHIVPFALQTEQALDHFNEWKSSLWFAPSALKNTTEADIKVNPIFVPYYLFDACVTSSYHGEFGKVITVTRSPTVHLNVGTNHNSHSGHSHNTGAHVHGPESYTETRWEKGSGVHEKDYKDKRVSATTNADLAGRMQKVDNWDLSAMQVGTTDASALATPVAWQHAWKEQELAIKNKEQAACEKQLKDRNCADSVRHMHVTTDFNEIRYKTVYLPVYEASYNYNGDYYKVVINGQTGKVDGDRPMGLGMIGDLLGTIGSLGGLFKGEQEPVAWIDGKTLNSREKRTTGLIFQTESGHYYHDSAQYLLFPYARTGWIELENTGNGALIVGSQQRKTSKLEHVHRIQPHSKAVYNFSGHWCIRLMKGRVQNVTIAGVSTQGLSNKVGKADGNKLHMMGQ